MNKVGSIVKCVLTGGPCGGKSSAADILKKEAPTWGFKLIFVPEVYTILVANGVEYPGDNDEDKLFDFHAVMLKMQLQMEDSFISFAEQYAKRGENVLVLLDRGFIDNKAYVSESLWNRVLNHFQYSCDEDILQRYDAILHLTSVAVDAEYYYSTEGHCTRLETAEESRQLDCSLLQVWRAHPCHFIVDNSPPIDNTEASQDASFKWKMKRICDILQNYLKKITINSP